MLPRLTVLALFAVLTSAAGARGVSPWLPLSQSPEMERAVERVLILADKPILTRPIAAAAVFDALPVACERDAALCEEVRHYLRGLMKSAGIAHFSAAAGAGSSASTTLQNRHGMRSDSPYEISAQLYWQPGDHVLFNGGFNAFEDEVVPTGSLISIGFEYAQLDIGWRDHWLSPMTDSAMLLSTEAQTMPSVTLSNYVPLTRFKLRYELFYAQMSESDVIAFEGGLTSGNPRLAGMHLSIEPVRGWSLGVNRLMQYGGGERANDSLGDLFDAWFRPSESDNTGTVNDFGNQVASITSSFVMPAEVPFSVYFEYAGEDTSTNNDLRLGNAALSAGIHFPRLGRNLDLTFEVSEWQNGWYVHHIYGDGLRNEGNVIGHWGGDRRVPGDGVGGMSLMTRLGWQLDRGGSLEATYRTLDNEDYTAPDYERAHSLDVRYSRRWGDDFFVGGELNVGRDVFGEDYSRVSAFIRF
ncbi:MAG: capsule assembly Wzi family protein [Woeseia sp.]